VAAGKAFLLQGGDCAETFDGRHRGERPQQAPGAAVDGRGAHLRGQRAGVKLGRLAGQYAKPRSSDDETREGVTLPAYRGDAVNGSPSTRLAHSGPERLLDVYNASAATLNLTRAFVTGGYADLRQVHAWNTDFVRTSPVGQRYEAVAGEIDRALSFMDACGVSPDALGSVDFFASHEALIVDYEQPMTRLDSRTGLPYDVSGHFLWIGERTRQLDGAHVELLSRVATRSASSSAPRRPRRRDRAGRAARPAREAGRLTFITRVGATRVRDLLPELVEKVTAAACRWPWVCDPMHGNTFSTSNGYKTREFDAVIDEVRGFFEVHRASAPGRRRARGADRRRRDRVPGRRRAAVRARPGAPLRVGLRPRLNRRSRWSWRSWSRRCCAPPEAHGRRGLAHVRCPR
jgi:3-deoxy-7-phosphoheptulonate synthase